VPGQLDNLFRRRHFAFPEGRPELAVINTGITACHENDDPAIGQAKSEGLGDATRLDAVRVGSQGNRGGADCQFDDRQIQIAGGKEITYGLQAHCGSRKARAKPDGRALDISGASSARQALALSALEGTHAMLQMQISTVMTLGNDFSAWRRPHPDAKTRCHLLPSARLP
jgi:hypothetical protein